MSSNSVWGILSPFNLGNKLLFDSAKRPFDRVAEETNKLKAARKTRYEIISAEEAARIAAQKKAETAGSRAGFGSAPASQRQAFLSSARGGTTGFSTSGAPSEDKIGRATLFGN